MIRKPEKIVLRRIHICLFGLTPTPLQGEGIKPQQGVDSKRTRIFFH
jgi:hypothetical protein